MTDTYPWLTLVPPLLAILLAIVTRKVIPSLGVGVLAAAGEGARVTIGEDEANARLIDLCRQWRERTA